MRALGVAGFGASLAAMLAAPACAGCGGVELGWELLGNTPATRAVFTVRNVSSTPFPATGWKIYFSSFLGIDPAGVKGQAAVEHVNGDIYALVPSTVAAAPLAPGASLRVEYGSEGPLVNVSAVPAGPYLVGGGTVCVIADYRPSPVNDASAGYVTPADLYAANKNIEDVPEAELPPVLPTPRAYSRLPGYFVIDGTTKIYADPAAAAEGAYLAGELAAVLGSRPALTDKPAGAGISLRRNGLPPEAYSLSVTSAGIEIAAGSPEGFFYGAQSLKELLPPAAWAAAGPVKVPAWRIDDAPRFGFRGLLLDVARNFKSKEEVMKVLDLMALYKLNVLHLHFSDDEGWRVEIPGLPELTQVGGRRGHGDGMLPPSFGSGPFPGASLGSGYYSRADFVEILKYAAARRIKVMPELESPGHARAAIKAMEYRRARLAAAGDAAGADEYLLSDPGDRSVYSTSQYWNDNVMCAALPSVYRFEAKVIDELAAMYKEAGAQLDTVHMGGDEVPAGAWEGSPAVKALMARDPSVKNTEDLWHYYFTRVAALLKERGLFLSGWEEAGLRKTENAGGRATEPAPGFAAEDFRVHVWSNMAGWGNEDLPYRLANAGYKVVLSCVGNNYFDMAYQKSPDEPGYNWGGYLDVDKPFSFVPYDYYRNARNVGGHAAASSVFEGKERLTGAGRANIAGLQGLLWGENMKSEALLEYMLAPKLLGLAERAWAPDPDWAVAADTAAAAALYGRAWSVLASEIGKRELPRLAYYRGGYAYRIPRPGLKVENGRVLANVQLPGFELRWTSDGSEPTSTSRLYTGPIEAEGKVKVRAFDGRGRGGFSSELPAR